MADVAASACPFCGGQEIKVIEGDTFRWRAAMCLMCEARGPSVRVQTCGEGNWSEWEAAASRLAITEWNQRKIGII